MTCFPIEEKKTEEVQKPSILNKMQVKLGAIFFIALAMLISPAGATIDTTNITDAIALIGTVGSAFITAMGTIFVDNLGTILTLVAVGVIITVFGGFGAMIVRFLFQFTGKIGSELNEKYARR